MKKNKWVKIFVIVLGVILAIGILKNVLIKAAVEIGAKAVTGAAVHIDSFSFSILRSSVHVKGFRMHNPKGFPNEPMVNIEEIRADYNLGQLLKGKIHLPLVILRLNELVIVKDKDGNLNVDALKVVQSGDKKEKKPEEKASKKESKQMAMQIDVAKLDLGKVIVKDYTKGEPPTVSAYDIGVHDKTFKDIKSAEQFATLILVQGMGPTALKSAGIYAAATILGVGFLPAGVAGVLISKDSGLEEYNADMKKTYATVLNVLTKMGSIVSEDASGGVIKAKVDGCDVIAKLTKLDGKKTEVEVSARKLMIPKAEVAHGVLYEVSKILK